MDSSSADMDEKPAKSSDADALIAEAKKFLEWAQANERENRREAETDLRFVKGEHWDTRVKQIREADGRPCITVNKLPTFLHQVTNDLRQNKPAIKASPVDDEADVETAEVVQGLIRHIEYDSNASACYITAGTYAAAAGFGFWRLITCYEAEDSFDQCIKFDRIKNQFSVYLGPHKEVDASDMMRALIAVDVPKDEFRREYPNADLSGATWAVTQGDRASGWVTEEVVRVGEYYRVECEDATLVMLADGSVGWKDELPKDMPGTAVLRERKSERRKVKWYKLTATEVIEETEVPCKWIPIFKVIGDEIDINGETVVSGVIRHARDPSYMYDLWMSSATEEVALRPKVPYIGAEGQFEGHEQKWRHANTRNYPYLEYKPVTMDGIMAPPPQRQPMADIPAGALQMAMHAADNIKATTGLFDASLGARGNETSGKAIVARQREGDVANYHIIDNLQTAIRHCGRCIVDMIPRVYDAPRVVRILGEDEQPKPVKVNQPMTDDMGAVVRVMNDLTIGRYDITVTMGPSYSTMRQEAADAMVQFGQSWPKLMDIAGDKVVKAMDWPGADDIAERIARTIPPEIRGDEDEQGEQPQLPPQIIQAIQQLQAENQQLQQMVAEAQSGVDKERIKAETAIRVAEINAAAKSDVAELTGWVKLLAQQMQPPPELTAAALTDGPAKAGLSVSTPPESDALGEQAPSGPGPAGQPGQESMQ